MEKSLLQNFSFLRYAPVCPVSFSILYTQTCCAMNNAWNPYFPTCVIVVCHKLPKLIVRLVKPLNLHATVLLHPLPF